MQELKGRVKMNIKEAKEHKIECRRCGGQVFKVIDKRTKNGITRRRKECKECGERLSTVELLVDEK